MLKLNGILLNVFKQNDFVDRKTGVVTPGRSRIQMQCQNKLKNGQIRIQLLDLSTDYPDAFRPFIGSEISFPVGVMTADQARQVLFFLPPDGHMQIEPVKGASAQAGAKLATSAA